MRVWCFLGGVLVVATRAKYADATMHALMPAHITHHTQMVSAVLTEWVDKPVTAALMALAPKLPPLKSRDAAGPGQRCDGAVASAVAATVSCEIGYLVQRPACSHVSAQQRGLGLTVGARPGDLGLVIQSFGFRVHGFGFGVMVGVE